jgi:hypothetical protein
MDKLVTITPPLLFRISLIILPLPKILNYINEGLKFYLDTGYALKNMKIISIMKE